MKSKCAVHVQCFGRVCIHVYCNDISVVMSTQRPNCTKNKGCTGDRRCHDVINGQTRNNKQTNKYTKLYKIGKAAPIALARQL